MLRRRALSARTSPKALFHRTIGSRMRLAARARGLPSRLRASTRSALNRTPSIAVRSSVACSVGATKAGASTIGSQPAGDCGPLRLLLVEWSARVWHNRTMSDVAIATLPPASAGALGRLIMIGPCVPPPAFVATRYLSRASGSARDGRAVNPRAGGEGARHIRAADVCCAGIP